MKGQGRLTLALAAPVVLAAWWAPLPAAGPGAALLRWAPWGAAAVLTLAGWRFRRGRLAVAALAVALAALPLAGGRAALAAAASRPERIVVAGLLALGLGLCALATSRPLAARRTAFLALAALGPLGAASLPGVAGRFPEGAGQAMLLGGTLLALGAWGRRRGPIEAAFLGLMVPVVLAGLSDAVPLRRQALLAAPGLLLVLALVEESYRLAYHDELTGLPGRRALEGALRELGGRYAVAMADVDRFKRFNDRFGHDAGDQALRFVAGRLARVRGARAYRYGGEEFALLFPGRDAAAAHEALERVRREIAGRPFVLRGADRPRRRPDRPPPGRAAPRRVRVTVSFGLAATEGGARSADLLRDADRALYRAKRAGRNRVQVVRRDPR